SSISSHDVSISDNNSSNTNDMIYSKVSLDKLAEITQPKMSQRLEAQLSQNSNSSCAVKKSVSSDRNKVSCLKETPPT
ncbi:23281_t:CDS:1, partial [Racocetra persica]